MEMFLFVLIMVNVFRGGMSLDVENYNFTYAMAMQCKEHICQHGYSYETFYRADESLATLVRDRTTNMIFEMHIAIQAASNGHILLSSGPNPGTNDRVYEIVVGGGGNKFTELRLNLKRNARSSAKTPNILSSINFRPFYIKIYSDGLIEFGKEGNNSVPILNYYDLDPLPIKYFSFASWTGVEAKFLYDCPAAGDDAISPNVQEPKLSNSDDLKRGLLMGRMPSIPPEPVMTVKLGVRITNVRYDPFESKLTTRVAVVMSWIDNSMSWEPNKFNDTKVLKFGQGQIWRPTFFVFNADNIDPFDTRNAELITVMFTGDTLFHFRTEINTLCMDSSEEMSRWPHDSYACMIMIEPWQALEKISIEPITLTDGKMNMFSEIDVFINNEWEFVQYKHSVVDPDTWDTVYSSYDNVTHQSDRYILKFILSRRATALNIAFYTPLLVLVTFILMSFWSEPLLMSRVWFYAGCAAIICMGLSNIDFLVPTHNTPSILILYIVVLIGVLIALLTQVILISPSTEKLCCNRLVQSILLSRLVRTLFSLHAIKNSINGGYDRHEDNDDAEDIVSPSTERMEVEEMDVDEGRVYGGKAELATVLDKLMFFVYSVTFVSMLAAHY